jgi:hypothetical protein
MTTHLIGGAWRHRPGEIGSLRSPLHDAVRASANKVMPCSARESRRWSVEHETGNDATLSPREPGLATIPDIPPHSSREPHCPGRPSCRRLFQRPPPRRPGCFRAAFGLLAARIRIHVAVLRQPAGVSPLRDHAGRQGPGNPPAAPVHDHGQLHPCRPASGRSDPRPGRRPGRAGDHQVPQPVSLLPRRRRGGRFQRRLGPDRL